MDLVGTQADAACLRAVETLLHDHFCVRPTESVVLTVDERSDATLVRVLGDGLIRSGARHCVIALPRLPFQGSLADPFVPEPVTHAVVHSDIWFDLTFPYMAGSGSFDAAMEAKRTRYLLMGDLSAAGFGRLYGKAEFEKLFVLQSAADQIFVDAVGKAGRITTPAGTDFTFTFGRPASVKHRRATQPGSQTIPGSAIFYPELESVRGRIVLEAAFHEEYQSVSPPLVIDLEGAIQRVQGGVDAAILERSLRRASREGLGHVIHLSVGLNPGAASTGLCFIEDIRVLGRNAVGMGLPWWLPGGGENHPDGVLRDQSLWIEDRPLFENGRPVSGHPLLGLLLDAEASMFAKSASTRGKP